jgi:hypothetical protein
MAAPYIAFHAGTIVRLQKFSDLRRALQWSQRETLGFLGEFWGQVGDLREAGDITGWTPEYLCDLLNVKLDPKRVWDALVEFAWIDVANGRALIHDWLDCFGRYLESKYRRSAPEKLMEIWALHGLTYIKPEQSRAEDGPPLPSSPDLTKRRKPSGAAKPPPDPRIAELQKGFYDALKIALGEEPAAYNGGAAGAGFRTLLTKYTFDQIVGRFPPWFASTDPYIVNHSFKVELFFGNFNALRLGPITKDRGFQGTGKTAGYAAPTGGKYAPR